MPTETVPSGPTPKIFCIGAFKTGTTSLGAFLASLGFPVGSQPAGERLLRDWAAGNFGPIFALARTAQAFQDMPFCCPGLFEHLDRAFPGARFILSVRDDAEQWYASLVRFHTRLVGKRRLPTAQDLKEFPYRYKGWLFEALQLIAGIPETAPYDKARLIGVYEAHNAAAIRHFRGRPDALLVVNLADPAAAARIVRFVGLPYAGQALPHLNRSDG
jgi:hypothetical protein